MPHKKSPYEKNFSAGLLSKNKTPFYLKDEKVLTGNTIVLTGHSVFRTRKKLICRNCIFDILPWRGARCQ
jgi:hypothetical protein